MPCARLTLNGSAGSMRAMASSFPLTLSRSASWSPTPATATTPSSRTSSSIVSRSASAWLQWHRRAMSPPPPIWRAWKRIWSMTARTTSVAGYSLVVKMSRPTSILPGTEKQTPSGQSTCCCASARRKRSSITTTTTSSAIAPVPVAWTTA